MKSEQDDLIERRDQAQRDLDELAAQVEDNEIDPATAERLRAAYQTELDQLDGTLGNLPKARLEPIQASSEPEFIAQTARSPRRMVIGSLVLIAALSVTIGYAARDAQPDTTQPVSASPGGLIVDPDSVSNEQLETVIAANPNINPMRMALADRYFEAEEYGAALEHYLYIADNNPTPEEESKALARVGWMAYRTGLADEATNYVELSLAADPTNPEATLYLGFITLYGLGDAEAAIPQLEAALELSNLSENVISQIDDALVDARTGTTP